MMEIINCEQGTPEWFAARLGIPTASMFSCLLSGRKDAKDKKTRQTYMLKLAGENLTGEQEESYTNAHMERGKEMEAEARSLYAFMTDADPVQVGFLKNHGAGASPDSLIGDDGGLEIKTALAHIQVDRLLNGTLPPEHRAQVQGNLWISGRQYWDFVSYCPKLPPLILTIPRDETYIANLAKAVEAFNEELEALVNSIHHQAVKDLGRDLVVEAMSGPDNIVEAIRYSKARFVMGLQWHPEFHRAGGPELLDCTPLLDTFLRAARETRF